MVILNKKLVFYISFLFQTLPFRNDVDSWTDITNGSRIELHKAFGYNFLNITEFKDVLVWKISLDYKSFKPQDYSNGFTEFGTNEGFLVFTQNWKCQFTLYYWVGTEITLEHKKYVAKHAVLFFFLMKIYTAYKNAGINLAREDEIFESESFIHTLNRLRSTPQPEDGRIGVYRDIYFPLNGPNLYLVRKVHDMNSIKIPVNVGLHLLRQGTCVVVETSLSVMEQLYPASMFCAESANYEVHLKAYDVASRICLKTDCSLLPKILFKRGDDCKAFVELLEDKENYRTSEIGYVENGNDGVSDEDGRTLLFKISVVIIDGQQTMIREAEIGTPYINNIDHRKNYIFDTKNISGIFFVYGEEPKVSEVVWAIQNAEEYLHNEISSRSIPIRMRIASTDSTKFPIDLTISGNLAWSN